MNIQEACELVRADYFAHRWVLLKRSPSWVLTPEYTCYNHGDASRAVASKLSAEDCAEICKELLTLTDLHLLYYSNDIDGPLSEMGTWAEVIRAMISDVLCEYIKDDPDIVAEEELRGHFEDLRDGARIRVAAHERKVRT